MRSISGCRGGNWPACQILLIVILCCAPLSRTAIFLTFRYSANGLRTLVAFERGFNHRSATAAFFAVVVKVS